VQTLDHAISRAQDLVSSLIHDAEMGGRTERLEPATSPFHAPAGR
jgi:hypothetical protein